MSSLIEMSLFASSISSASPESNNSFAPDNSSSKSLSDLNKFTTGVISENSLFSWVNLAMLSVAPSAERSTLISSDLAQRLSNFKIIELSSTVNLL